MDNITFENFDFDSISKEILEENGSHCNSNLNINEVANVVEVETENGNVNTNDTLTDVEMKNAVGNGNVVQYFDQSSDNTVIETAISQDRRKSINPILTSTTLNEINTSVNVTSSTPNNHDTFKTFTNTFTPSDSQQLHTPIQVLQYEAESQPVVDCNNNEHKQAKHAVDELNNNEVATEKNLFNNTVDISKDCSTVESQIDLSFHLNELTYITNNSYAMIEEKQNTNQPSPINETNENKTEIDTAKDQEEPMGDVVNNENKIETDDCEANNEESKKEEVSFSREETTELRDYCNSIYYSASDTVLDGVKGSSNDSTTNTSKQNSNSEIVITQIAKKVSPVSKPTQMDVQEAIQDEFVILSAIKTNGEKLKERRQQQQQSEIKSTNEGKHKIQENKMPTVKPIVRDMASQCESRIGTRLRIKTIIIDELVQTTTRLTYHDIIDDTGFVLRTELVSRKISEQVISKSIDTKYNDDHLNLVDITLMTNGYAIPSASQPSSIRQSIDETKQNPIQHTFEELNRIVDAHEEEVVEARQQQLLAQEEITQTDEQIPKKRKYTKSAQFRSVKRKRKSLSKPRKVANKIKIIPLAPSFKARKKEANKSATETEEPILEIVETPQGPETEQIEPEPVEQVVLNADKSSKTRSISTSSSGSVGKRMPLTAPSTPSLNESVLASFNKNVDSSTFYKACYMKHKLDTVLDKLATNKKQASDDQPQRHIDENSTVGDVNTTSSSSIGTNVARAVNKYEIKDCFVNLERLDVGKLKLPAKANELDGTEDGVSKSSSVSSMSDVNRNDVTLAQTDEQHAGDDGDDDVVKGKRRRTRELSNYKSTKDQLSTASNCASRGTSESRSVSRDRRSVVALDDEIENDYTLGSNTYEPQSPDRKRKGYIIKDKYIFAKWSDNGYYPATIIKRDFERDLFTIKYVLDVNASPRKITANELVRYGDLKKGAALMRLNCRKEYETTILDHINEDTFYFTNNANKIV